MLYVLLFAICLLDYRFFRIPNKLIIIIFFWGIGYRCLSLGILGLAGYFKECLFVFLLLYPLFKIGAIGAGDVKLFAVTSGYLSEHSVYYFLLYSLLFAAIFSIIKLVKEHNGREHLSYFCAYLQVVMGTKSWQLYSKEDKNDKNKKCGRICLSGPLFLSMLLHFGGVY